MPNVTPLSDCTAADIISGMRILETRDLGADIVHRGYHRHHGRCTVISTSAGASWLIADTGPNALQAA